MKKPQALWTVAPNEMELRDVDLPGAPPDGAARVRALYSGVSRGTERLVMGGHVPEAEWQRMRAPFQEGDFPFPVKYGYSLVGEVVAGSPALGGRRVFALAPHQSLIDLPEAALRPIPDEVPSTRAMLAANVETALNALWDGAAGPGDRIAVVGAGLVGGLVAALASRLPGAEVTLVDPDPKAAELALHLQCRWTRPDDPPTDCDLVFHASGRGEGLSTAIACAGFEATVVEMSWYGATPVTVPLGGRFHAGRIRLVSSQVGSVSTARRPRWDYARRLGKALDLLRDPLFDIFVGTGVPFEESATRLPALLETGGGAGPYLCY
ncbi:zinc-binding alcohol dehydrogenase [Lacibacterium aquatile]|uniref:Zinc-binding alcohol dehydrogenase n=1 Tax=Lacibacterium aquatile TaxID=1168082 RepID=A0ABW5DJX4_9PROT